MKPTLLVLAAGMGSRYGGLKQLDGVGPNDEPILEYSVYDALRAGFGKVVFVIRPEFAEPFEEKITSRFTHRLPIEYVYQDLAMVPSGFSVPLQRQKPWGTGHAILVSEPAITEPFVVINADDFYGATAYQMLEQYLAQIEDLASTDYAMVGYTLRNTLSDHGSVARGICQREGDYLKSIIELTNIERVNDAAHHTDAAGQVHPLSGDEVVSLNIWGFTPAIFDQLRSLFDQFLRLEGQLEKSEFYIPSAIGDLVSAGHARVKVLASQDPWFGVTYRDDKPRVIESVQALIAQGRYPEHLWS